MLFSSNVFLFVFLPAVLILYYLPHWQLKNRNILLLVASLLFYAWGEPVYVFLMLASICVNYLLGRLTGKKENRTGRGTLLIALFWNLGVLFFFKYWNFVTQNLNLLLHTHIPGITAKMPIGISFFTFQAMSYVIDVYRGTVQAQQNILDLGLYISFFPQLIAGPIVRYNTIADQITARESSPELARDGILRFAQGLAKKVVVANNLSILAETVFASAAGRELSVPMAWIGSLAYTFQIFFDFSGYSDMAIGLGRMFGFRFEENFHFPYISRSISEFWNRWHISLGRWFRDYVYFPMGGSRVDRKRLVVNLMTVWLLTGIWHGAAWQFIVWGVGYGVLISLEKLSGIPRRLKNRTAVFLYAVFTFLVVNFGWVLFGAQGLSAGLYQIGCMFARGAVGSGISEAAFALEENWFYFLAAVLFSLPLPKRMAEKLVSGREDSAFASCLRTVWILGLLLLSVSFLAMGAHNPFIYFNF